MPRYEIPPDDTLDLVLRGGSIRSLRGGTFGPAVGSGPPPPGSFHDGVVELKRWLAIGWPTVEVTGDAPTVEPTVDSASKDGALSALAAMAFPLLFSVDKITMITEVPHKERGSLAVGLRLRYLSRDASTPPRRLLLAAHRLIMDSRWTVASDWRIDLAYEVRTKTPFEFRARVLRPQLLAPILVWFALLLAYIRLVLATFRRHQGVLARDTVLPDVDSDVTTELRNRPLLVPLHQQAGPPAGQRTGHQADVVRPGDTRMSWHRPVLGTVLVFTVASGCAIAIALGLVPARHQPWLGVLLLAAPYFGARVALSQPQSIRPTGERA